MNHLALTTGLLSLCVIIAGCSSAEEPVVVEMTPAVAPEAAPTPSEAVRPAENTSPTPDLAEPDLAEPESAPLAQFTAPFPERTELFEPPKRAQGTARRDDEQGETVELKGFVNVDRPLAVMSIDGVIAPIPEGGEKYGVQVLSIQPPTVIWQRGRDRRTETLE